MQYNCTPSRRVRHSCGSTQGEPPDPDLAYTVAQIVSSSPAIIVHELSVSLFHPNSVRRTDARWLPPAGGGSILRTHRRLGPDVTRQALF